MSGVLDKIKNMMLGTDYDEDNYDDADYDDQPEYVSRDDEEDEPVRGFNRRDARERSESDVSRKQPKNAKILNFQSPQTSSQTQVMLTHPADVQDATLVCDHIKENKICVVNLEGVERGKAQRIADFLGGAAFALNGEIQRISNEIFIIAPASAHITGDLKEELKAGASGHVLSWASSFK